MPPKTTAVQKRGCPESHRYLSAGKPLSHPLPSPEQVLVTNSGTRRGNPASISPGMPEPLKNPADLPRPGSSCLATSLLHSLFGFFLRSKVLEEQGS